LRSAGKAITQAHELPMTHVMA